MAPFLTESSAQTLVLVQILQQSSREDEKESNAPNTAEVHLDIGKAPSENLPEQLGKASKWQRPFRRGQDSVMAWVCGTRWLR